MAKKLVSLLLAAVCIFSVFSVSVYGAVKYTSYNGKYGVLTTVKSDYKTKNTLYKFNKDSGTVYFNFDSKGKQNAYYSIKLYSDSEKTSSVLDMTNAFPLKDTTAKITLDFSEFESGVYYGETHTFIKKGDNTVIDSDSVCEFQIKLNKIGNATPVFTQWDALYTGNYLAWDSVKYADVYRIYRKESADASWKKLEDVTECTFLDTTAVKGQKYYYTVRAFDNGSESKYNKTGVALVYLDRVEFAEAPIRLPDNGVKLSWHPVDGAESYRIYRKKAEDSKYKGIARVSADITEYTDSSAKKNGEVYLYKIRAVNGTDLGPSSKAATAEVFGVFKPNVYCKGTTVTVSWDAIEGADGYVLYKLTADGQWEALELQQDSAEYADEALEPGNKYTYSLVVKKGAEESSFDSTGVSIECLGAPVITSAGCSIKNSVCIKWKKVSGAQRYNIYRKSPVSDYEYVGTTADNVFYDSTEKTNNLNYKYKVQAVSEKCEGLMGDESKAVLYMAAPKLVSVKWDEGNSVKWKRVAGATAYNIYRKTPTGSYKKIAQVKNALEYVDTSAKKGTKYYYTVSAVNGTVVGAYETGLGINCLSPVSFTVKGNSNGSVTLKWTKVSGASGYYVYRKLSGTSKWETLGKTTSLTYTDKSKKTSGKIYDYTVRAYNAKGGSAYYDKIGQNIMIP